MNETMNMSDIMRRVFPNTGNGPVVGHPVSSQQAMATPVSESSEARFSRLANRIQELESRLVRAEAVVKFLPPAFVELDRHIARIDANFHTLRVVGNDFYLWACAFLDAYNQRHSMAAPLHYPPILPPEFAFPPSEVAATNRVNAERQELLNENAVLRKEYDEIHARVLRLEDEAVVAREWYLDDIDEVQRQLDSVKAAAKQKPPAKKPVKKKSAK